MNRQLFPPAFFLLILFILCAAKERPWTKGRVTFLNGDTLSCTLRFTRKVKEGLLQVQDKGERIQILTARHVAAFEFFDEGVKQNRYFRSLTVQPELSGRKHEVFMEVLFEGEYYSIVNHRMLGYAETSIQFNPFKKKHVVDNLYLVDHETSQVVPMTRENFLQIVRTKRKEVDHYLQLHPNLKSVGDYMRVLEYHQALL